ncbi:MAG TPA: hypothetical protein VKE27_05810 [Candidatus Dormibacteraeota bacterium]|nr:hypothetical protein [Candidatus Dormibacteraeota bacterium]
MRTVRWLAVAVVALLAAYFVLRAMASACAGAACDVYIPISLLLPLLILVAVAVTGITATMNARQEHSWFAGLLLSTILGVAGPILALLILKDSPDAFVATGTVLELQVAIVAFAYTYIRTRPASAR